MKGSVQVPGAANVSVAAVFNTATNTITLAGENLGATPVTLTITDAYTGAKATVVAQPGKLEVGAAQLDASYGWYDYTITATEDATFQVQLAGHLETGNDSMSDPLIGV